MSKSKNTTEIGYENRKGQINLGRTGELGTDHMQYLYKMQCKFCNTEYKSNGSDIFQRKCPECQGGRP
ncbi:MAG TPA: hypothetical protein VF941_10910 [Clostridia bacterium]